MACECSEVNHKFVLAEDFNLIKKKKTSILAPSLSINCSLRKLLLLVKPIRQPGVSGFDVFLVLLIMV